LDCLTRVAITEEVPGSLVTFFGLPLFFFGTAEESSGTVTGLADSLGDLSSSLSSLCLASLCRFFDSGYQAGYHHYA